jgi:hypothetical protein
MRASIQKVTINKKRLQGLLHRSESDSSLESRYYVVPQKLAFLYSVIKHIHHHTMHRHTMHIYIHLCYRSQSNGEINHLQLWIFVSQLLCRSSGLCKYQWLSRRLQHEAPITGLESLHFFHVYSNLVHIYFISYDLL